MFEREIGLLMFEREIGLLMFEREIGLLRYVSVWKISSVASSNDFFSAC